MPGVQPATNLTRAGVESKPLGYEPSWMAVPFDSYEGMTQMGFQESNAAFVRHGEGVPVVVPKGWRRVEGQQPGKHFYVHMATGAITKTPKDIYNCQAKSWETKEGQRMTDKEVLLAPELRALEEAYSDDGSKRHSKIAAALPKTALPGAPALEEAPVASPKTAATAVRQTSADGIADGKLPVGLLFPGQGSQYVKMLQTTKDLPAVKEMLATAQRILGYDLLDLCLNGPESKLEMTKHCQPAMYIGGLAGVEKLRVDKPERVDRCQAVAGLSLGEYTALTVAGVMDLETGLEVVKLRGEAMQEAAEASKQMMLSVAGLPKEHLDQLCQESCEAPSDVCQVANFLFPAGYSCAGTADAIERLMAKAQKADGCLQAKLLKTSGGFHTKLMAPAREKLLSALKAAEPKLKPPRCDIYLNVTGQKIAAGTPPGMLIELLADQLVNCVLWEPSMREMIKDGVSEFYECGPMKQLKAMMKRIDVDVFARTSTVDV
eukprot:TRINITY_DN5309_c0_g2_i1.p1 TRINITY_DN5309_c0_g2~~TRINITY_DN5309_c0_g2_i1.p1  ORF type:complete len:490 (-),score=131.03 TRINITY_DN5309_c0_g2_i1:26-1495(-)